jgi:single-strand DNA-binding protein
MSINKVILVGNVGGDPEIRNTNDGREIATFSLATSDSWKDKNTGERKDKTEWHRIVIFSQGLVGIVKNYVKKGSKLYIEGQIQTRKWTDNNGVDKYTTEIIMQNFNSTLQILDSKNSGGSNSGGGNYDNPDYNNNSGNSGKNNNSQQNKPQNEANFSEDLDDDIPF